MTNYQRFKTPNDRIKGFRDFCSTGCENCILLDRCNGNGKCGWAYWLDLNVPEEKILPCPFCGGEMGVACDDRVLVCTSCKYELRRQTHEKVVSDHNAVAGKFIKALEDKNNLDNGESHN